MAPPRWETSASFALLCDLVAEGRIVALTGAGFSYGLKDAACAWLPGWEELLGSIADEMSPLAARPPTLAALVETAKTGQELIELASMLSAIDPDGFARRVRERLTPAPWSDQDPDAVAAWERKHDALLALRPCGIVTMNIDELHEGVLVPKGWNVICPLDATSDPALRRTVQTLGEEPFVLQAHGALKMVPDRPHQGLVFTWESYRDLITARPSYAGFMVHLFSTTSFLFLGYGLSDLDFDQLLWHDAARFGAAVRNHVVLQRWPSGADEEEDRRRLQAASAIKEARYGIRTIWLEEWAQVADVLEATLTTPGPAMRDAIDGCFHVDREVRTRAHDHLRHLGEVGKAIAIAALTERISTEPHGRERDEAIYSLGRIEPKDPARRRQIAEALLDVAETTPNISSAAHALVALPSYTEEPDLPRLEAISHRMQTETLASGTGALWEADIDGRLRIYAEFLVLRLRARLEIATPRPVLGPGPT